MAERYDAGIVTAYGAAVRGGYTGTYDEFCAQQAGYAQSAAAVAQAKTDAEAAAQTAQDVADSIPADYTQLSEDVSSLKEDLDDVETALETKAEIDGYYEDMTVGDAEQLVSTVTNADDTPYNFRTTAGSVDVGDRAYVDAIVGGTLCVNQLMQSTVTTVTINGITFTHNDGVWSISGTATGRVQTANVFNRFDTISGHKYLVYLSKAITPFALRENNGSLQQIATSKVLACTEGKLTYFTFDSGVDISGSTVDIQNLTVMLFDLTQTFDTTIADYVYGLETATAGAGVAWLKANAPKIFDGGYIPFNAGTLQSVVGLSEKRNTGLNQWDEEWVNGRWAENNGVFNPAFTSYLASKNPIHVLPNTTYYFSIDSSIMSGREVVYYDASDNWISDAPSFYANATFTTPSNCHYVRFNLGSAYGNTYKNDICINLHWDGEKDGTYEPYTLHTYAFDPTVELRGVPKLKDGKMYFDGDRYLPDGTVNRRYGVVDLGTLTWYKSGNPQRFEGSAISNAKAPATTYTMPNIMTDIYMPTNSSDGASDHAITLNINGEPRIYDSAKYQSMSASEFKTAMNGVMCVYELATSTTETATPYNPVEIVDDFGTEEFITTSLVPVGHETRYAPNLRAKLEMSPDSPDGDGLYIVQQSGGENTYIPLASSATIQNILARLTALEGNTNEG